MCGSNETSQLAMKNVTSMAQPQRTAALDAQVVDTVTCGANFTVAVTKRGELIGWGGGEYGQIGPPCVVQQAVPRIIKGMAPAARIERVAAGSAHVLALSEQYQVYSFGAGLHGALGLGNTESTCVPASRLYCYLITPTVAFQLPWRLCSRTSTQNIISAATHFCLCHLFGLEGLCRHQDCTFSI